MANISTYLQKILSSVYGRDVRQSIHDGISAINDEVATYNAKEQSRVNAEKTREANETRRNTAESQRATAENARVTEETKRNQAENTRETAETRRKSEETQRVASENERKAQFEIIKNSFVTVDESLTVAGRAADAKLVGEALGAIGYNLASKDAAIATIEQNIVELEQSTVRNTNQIQSKLDNFKTDFEDRLIAAETNAAELQYQLDKFIETLGSVDVIVPGSFVITPNNTIPVEVYGSQGWEEVNSINGDKGFVKVWRKL